MLPIVDVCRPYGGDNNLHIVLENLQLMEERFSQRISIFSAVG